MRNEYKNGSKTLSIRIESSMDKTPWGSITDEELDTVLDTLQQAEKAIIMLRAKIKKVPVVKVKPIKPGLTPEQVVEKITDWLTGGYVGQEGFEKFGWDSVWINVQGDVAYSKWMADPEDDGYIKGFQIAFDIHTNRMIARNCDNIWKSLSRRGYTQLTTMDQLTKHYKGYKDVGSL